LTGSLGGLFGTEAAVARELRPQGRQRRRVQSPGFVYAIRGPFRKQR
jgi:hypothetical protein